MDRLIYTAMTGANAAQYRQQLLANNLALDTAATPRPALTISSIASVSWMQVWRRGQTPANRRKLRLRVAGRPAALRLELADLAADVRLHRLPVCGHLGQAAGFGHGQSEIEVERIEAHRKIRTHMFEFPYCEPIPRGVNWRP